MTSSLVEDEAALKEWICERIPSTFEGEPDAFAKYVVALLRKAPAGAGELASLRRKCVEQLDAFLQGETEVFVNRLFDAIVTKSYLPTSGVIEEKEEGRETALDSPLDSLANGRAADVGAYTVDKNSRPQVRPRILAPDSPCDPISSADHSQPDPISRPLDPSPRRPAKRIRVSDEPEQAGEGSSDNDEDEKRGVRKIRRVEFTTREARRKGQRQGLSERFSHIDGAVRGGAGGEKQKGRGRTCRSYEMLGYCLRGERCPHSHGPHPVVVLSGGGGGDLNSTYNPEAPSINLARPPFGSRTGGGSGAKRPQLLRRALPLPKTNSLLVKLLPHEYNTISQLNDYFAQFGELKNIQTAFEGQQDTALVTYESIESATRAYRSQQPIFNNRFVHLQWYREGDFAADTPHLPIMALPPPQLVIPVLASAPRPPSGVAVETAAKLLGHPRVRGSHPACPPNSASAVATPQHDSTTAKATLLKLKTRLYLKHTEKLKLLLTQMKSLGDTTTGSQSPTASDSADALKKSDLAKQISELSAELRSLREEIVVKTGPTNAPNKMAPPHQAGFGSAI